MKKSKIWALLAGLTMGTLLGGGCTEAFRSAVYTGFSNFVTGEISSGLNNAIPLDLVLSDVIRKLLNPSI